jgi:hypothetical protein
MPSSFTETEVDVSVLSGASGFGGGVAGGVAGVTAGTGGGGMGVSFLHETQQNIDTIANESSIFFIRSDFG